MVLFNDDAWVEDDYLTPVLTAFSDSKVGIVMPKVLRADDTIDSTGDEYSIWGLAFPRGRDETDAGKYDQPQKIFAASGGAAILRRQLLEDIGLFDEDFFAYYEDIDLSFRAQLAGWDVRYEPSGTVRHDVGGTSSKIPNFTTFHSLKNLPWLMIKNVPGKYLWAVWPRFVIAHASFWGAAVLRGQFLTAMRAVIVALLLTPKKFYQRWRIQRQRRRSPQEIWAMMYKDVPKTQKKLRKLLGKD